MTGNPAAVSFAFEGVGFNRKLDDNDRRHRVDRFVPRGNNAGGDRAALERERAAAGWGKVQVALNRGWLKVFQQQRVLRA